MNLLFKVLFLRYLSLLRLSGFTGACSGYLGSLGNQKKRGWSPLPEHSDIPNSGLVYHYQFKRFQFFRMFSKMFKTGSIFSEYFLILPRFFHYTKQKAETNSSTRILCHPVLKMILSLLGI